MPKATPKAARPRRPRGSINPDEIIAGAFEVARRVSLDQLSMPALAEHLGVGVTSIYWYFRKKEDLLSTMCDVAIEAFIKSLPPLSADEPWQQVLCGFFRATREAHRQDEILSDLLLLRISVYSRHTAQLLFELEEAGIRTLVTAGFTTENAFRVFNTAMVFTRGMVLHERVLRLSNAPTFDDRQRKIADWSALPLLESLVDSHRFTGSTDTDFEFGMSRLICGFETLLREQEAAAAPAGPKAEVAAAKPKAARARKRSAASREQAAS